MKLPQLSLRELFLLVALAAMGLGWWVEHHGIAPMQRRNQILESWRKLAEDGGYKFVHFKNDDGEGSAVIPPKP